MKNAVIVMGLLSELQADAVAIYLLLRAMHYLERPVNDKHLQVLVGINPYFDLKLQKFKLL